MKDNLNLTDSPGPVIVLGMHKSGTTLISETLHESGISMVAEDTSHSYDEGNKMERQSTQKINIELLDCEGVLSHRIIAPFQSDRLTESLQNRGQALVNDLHRRYGSNWGFKDPRTLLTYEYWLGLIESPKLLGIYRGPVEVFQHYAKRKWWRWMRRDPLLLVDALKAWCIYNQKLITISEQNSECLILCYDDLMSCPDGLKKIEKFLDLSITDKRRQDMRRSKPRKTLLYRAACFILKKFYGLDVQKIHQDLKARS